MPVISATPLYGGRFSRRSVGSAAGSAAADWVQIALLSLAVGCGRRTPASLGLTVRDSAGVQIVDNAGAGELSADILDHPKTTLLIGREDGPEYVRFFRITSVFGHADHIYVVDAGEQSLRVFDTKGEYVRTIGRAGEGPGEFGEPAFPFITGDTLVIWDARLRRVTLFSLAGEVLDVVSLKPPEGGVGWIYPVARTRTGWEAVSVVFTPTGPVGSTHVDSIRVLQFPGLHESDPNSVRTIVTFPWVRWYTRMAGEGPGGFPAFGSQEHFYTVDRSGWTYVPDAQAYDVAVYSPAGTLVRRIRRNHRPIAMTDKLVDRYRERVRAYWDSMERAGRNTVGRAADLELASGPRQAVLAPIGRLIVGSDGALWLERLDLVADPLDRLWTRPRKRSQFWDWFDRSGISSAPSRCPTGFRRNQPATMGYSAFCAMIPGSKGWPASKSSIDHKVGTDVLRLTRWFMLRRAFARLAAQWPRRVTWEGRGHACAASGFGAS